MYYIFYNTKSFNPNVPCLKNFESEDEGYDRCKRKGSVS